MSQNSVAARTSQGVEALIARVRDEGVAAGKQEGERIVAEAHAHAREIIEKAETSARTQVEAAAAEADALRRAGEDALRMAMRNAILAFKERLANRFAVQVGKSVSGATRDEEFLKRMILAVAGRARAAGRLDEAGAVEIELPRIVSVDELRRNPEDVQTNPLMQFVAASAGELLREGVAFSRGEDVEGGIRAKLTNEGVSLDLTDKAVTDILLAHLQPRFRALLEGVVR